MLRNGAGNAAQAKVKDQASEIGPGAHERPAQAAACPRSAARAALGARSARSACPCRSPPTGQIARSASGKCRNRRLDRRELRLERMEVKRGCLVVAVHGEFGRPRPVVVVQADEFNQTTTLLVCPV